MKGVFGAICSLLVLFPSSARAEEPLALQDVLQSVRDAYPLVRAALFEQGEAKGTRLAAQGGFDPAVRAMGTLEAVSGYPKEHAQVVVEQPTALWGTSVFGGYRIGRGTFPAYDGKLETNDYGEVRAGVRVPLLRDGSIDRRRATLRQAELGATMAELSVAEQRIEAIRRASQRYWEWVAAGLRRDVIAAWLSLAQNRDKAIADRVAHGDVPEIERKENERAILQRQGALIAAERDLELAAVELSLFLRGKDGSPILPKESRRPRALPEPRGSLAERIAAETAALANRPDVKRLEAVRARSEVEFALAKNQRLWAVDLVGSGSKDLGPGDAKRAVPVLEVGILVDIPVLGRAQDGRKEASAASVQKNAELLRFAKDRAVNEVRSALVGMETSERRSGLVTKELAVARTLAEAELRRFELGESNLLLVNLREQASAEAEVRHIDALLDYHRAAIQFRAAVARDG